MSPEAARALVNIAKAPVAKIPTGPGTASSKTLPMPITASIAMSAPVATPAAVSASAAVKTVQRPASSATLPRSNSMFSPTKMAAAWVR